MFGNTGAAPDANPQPLGLQAQEVTLHFDTLSPLSLPKSHPEALCDTEQVN